MVDQIESFTQKRQIDAVMILSEWAPGEFIPDRRSVHRFWLRTSSDSTPHIERKTMPRPSYANSLGGFIPTTLASAGNFGLTTYWYADDLRHHRNLKRQKALPGELTAERLRTLDELDKIVGTTKSN